MMRAELPLAACKILFLQQRGVEAAQGGVAGDACASNAAADDDDNKGLRPQLFEESGACVRRKDGA
jgi:hypothetical protein